MSASPDPDGLLYAEHWEPVLAAPSAQLLERVAARVQVAGIEARLILDVGAGTGSLALAAAERWPTATIVGLDASAGMLSVARHRAEARWPGRSDRFRWLAAEAAAIPLEDASVDLAVSSFVLQLVADRRAVLSEVRRVLRPGSVLGFVTWQRDDDWLAPDVEFDEAVYDLDLDEPEADARTPAEREYESPEEAAADLRASGFVDIAGGADEPRSSPGSGPSTAPSRSATTSASCSTRSRWRTGSGCSRASTSAGRPCPTTRSSCEPRSSRPRPAARRRPDQAAKGGASSGRQTRQGR